MDADNLAKVAVLMCLPFPVVSALWAVHGKHALLTSTIRLSLLVFAFLILFSLYGYVRMRA